ncbi:MAG TPA: NADH-quinone oxidoreductase subunit M [Acidimicrobiales bacterium]|nr:NADH-quinone oxidoreductase subunit M [Acidimicrobiales bacterium]
MGYPILNVLIFLPLAGAVVVMAIPAARADLARYIGVGFAVVELGFVVDLVVQFKTVAGFQFVSNHSWISAFGISWHLGVDGISLFLVAMTALLFPIAMAGPRVASNPRSFMGWMLVLEAGCIATFVAMDLFVFFVMFEVTLVPGYFVIAGWGGLRRNYAAFKFFIYTFAGSAFLFVGILSVWFLVGRRTGHNSFDLITITRTASHLPLVDQKLILLAFVAAFAVKIPLVPFHTWLPDAYTEAPTAGSMVIAGILFKLGAYGILRFGVFIFPTAAIDLAPLLLTLAAIGIIYGAVVATVQRDFKRLVAYGSVADVGFIVLGVFAFTSQGITGGVLEMVNHGLTTGAMFFLVGMIWERRRTLRISELGGLQKSAPVMAGVFVLVIMAAIGLPGLNGFVGEFLVLVGTFITHRWWAVVGAVGVILAAVYLLWAFQRVFQGPARGANATMADMTWRERGAIAPLLVGIVFLGVYPAPVLNRITPSVSNLLAHVHSVDPHFKIPPSGTTKVVYAVPANQAVDGALTGAAR